MASDLVDHHSRFAAPSDPHFDNWDSINLELYSRLSPLHSDLAQDLIDVAEAGDLFSSIVSSLLSTCNPTPSRPCGGSSGPHRHISTDKLLANLAEKNTARKQFQSDPGTYLSDVRVHNRCLKASRKSAFHRSALKQEKAFRSNLWEFFKSVCCSKSSVEPSFTSSKCFEYFQHLFSSDCGPPLLWSPYLGEGSIPAYYSFGMSPITPAVIRCALNRCSNGSTPGPDKISYFHIKMLPCTHHFLATLFSKIISVSHNTPLTWCNANIILIHKNGDTSCPSNFRPIALTSTIGKLFHRILARRLEEYLLDRDIIDPSIQKGFLSGIDGVIKHILSLNCIINNSKTYNLPLFLTFIDLRNAFGSVHHDYIRDMLTLI